MGSAEQPLYAAQTTILSRDDMSWNAESPPNTELVPPPYGIRRSSIPMMLSTDTLGPSEGGWLWFSTPGPLLGGEASSCVTFVTMPVIGRSSPAFAARRCARAAPLLLPITYTFPLAPSILSSAIIAAKKAPSSGSVVHSKLSQAHKFVFFGPVFQPFSPYRYQQFHEHW